MLPLLAALAAVATTTAGVQGESLGVMLQGFAERRPVAKDVAFDSEAISREEGLRLFREAGLPGERITRKRVVELQKAVQNWYNQHGYALSFVSAVSYEGGKVQVHCVEPKLENIIVHNWNPSMPEDVAPERLNQTKSIMQRSLFHIPTMFEAADRGIIKLSPMNARTRPSYVARGLNMHPGELLRWDRPMLQRFLQRGPFSAAEFGMQLSEDMKRANITVEARERPARSFIPSVTIARGSFTTDVVYQDTNFVGQGLNLELEASKTRTEPEMSIRTKLKNPNLGLPGAASVSLYKVLDPLGSGDEPNDLVKGARAASLYATKKMEEAFKKPEEKPEPVAPAAPEPVAAAVPSASADAQEGDAPEPPVVATGDPLEEALAVVPTAIPSATADVELHEPDVPPTTRVTDTERGFLRRAGVRLEFQDPFQPGLGLGFGDGIGAGAGLRHKVMTSMEDVITLGDDVTTPRRKVLEVGAEWKLERPPSPTGLTTRLMRLLGAPLGIPVGWAQRRFNWELNTGMVMHRVDQATPFLRLGLKSADRVPLGRSGVYSLKREQSFVFHTREIPQHLRFGLGGDKTVRGHNDGALGVPGLAYVARVELSRRMDRLSKAMSMPLQLVGFCDAAIFPRPETAGTLNPNPWPDTDSEAAAAAAAVSRASTSETPGGLGLKERIGFGMGLGMGVMVSQMRLDWAFDCRGNNRWHFGYVMDQF